MNFRVTLLPALALPVALLLAAEPEKDPRGSPKMRLEVPAYFYPAGKGLREWDRLIEAARRVPVVAVVNPDSGPGKKADANYVAVIGRAREAGVTLVGYVSTRYGKRPLAEVKADVDAWVEFHPKVQGIHVDEQASEAAKVDYYAELYEHVRKKIPGGLVLSNPGTDCARDYVSRPAADVVCLFERDKGFEDFRPPAWAARFPPGRFAAIAYQVETAERMQEYVRAAEGHHIGLVYFTDAKSANPYDRLPSYWEAEVAAVERVNRGTGP